MNRHGCAALFAAAMALLAGREAAGGAFAVAPVRVELRPGQNAGELTVRNQTGEATLIQVRVVAWSQRDGDEQYADTRDVLVTPPVFTLPASGEQVIRVALRRPAEAIRELSYRLFVQEVPPAADPDARQLTMALRVSLPIFIAPAAAHANVLWAARELPDGRLELTATNAGTAHLQIIDFDLQFGATALPGSRTNKYLLAGANCHWTLVVPAGMDRNQSLSVHGHGDQGDFNLPVARSQP